MTPRSVPSRNSKYMGLALMVAGFSKDPATQVGCVIVDAKNNEPLGYGYNGPPSMVDDSLINWDRKVTKRHPNLNKYDCMIHAEENALEHCDKNLLNEDCIIYVTARPCNKCLTKIANTKVNKIVYLDFTSDAESSLNQPENVKKSEELANLYQLELHEFYGDLSWIYDRALDLRSKGII